MHILSKTAISMSVAGALLVTIVSFTHAAKPENKPNTDVQAEAPKDGLGMITGTVTDAESKPLKGVAVGLQFQNRRKQDGDPADNKQNPPTTKPVAIQTTKTDANGHYTFEDVKPGTYVVIARDRQHGNFRKQVVLGENQEVTVDMKLKARPGQTGNENNNQNKPK